MSKEEKRIAYGFKVPMNDKGRCQVMKVNQPLGDLSQLSRKKSINVVGRSNGKGMYYKPTASGSSLDGVPDIGGRSRFPSKGRAYASCRGVCIRQQKGEYLDVPSGTIRRFPSLTAIRTRFSRRMSISIIEIQNWKGPAYPLDYFDRKMCLRCL